MVEVGYAPPVISDQEPDRTDFPAQNRFRPLVGLRPRPLRKTQHWILAIRVTVPNRRNSGEIIVDDCNLKLFHFPFSLGSSSPLWHTAMRISSQRIRRSTGRIHGLTPVRNLSVWRPFQYPVLLEEALHQRAKEQPQEQE